MYLYLFVQFWRLILVLILSVCFYFIDGKSKLLSQYVIPINQPSTNNLTSPSSTNNSTNTTSNSSINNNHHIDTKEEDTMFLSNPEIRDALSSAIYKLGDEPGKLSVNQFISILKMLMGQLDDVPAASSNNNSKCILYNCVNFWMYFIFHLYSSNFYTLWSYLILCNSYYYFSDNANPVTPQPVRRNSNTANLGQGLGLILLCRFIDRDGDGYISADDIFTSQALILQRSEIFLRVSINKQ